MCTIYSYVVFCANDTTVALVQLIVTLPWLRNRCQSDGEGLCA